MVSLILLILKVQSVTKEAKERIEAAGYKIGFEINFDFGQPSLLYLAGHMSPGVPAVIIPNNDSEVDLYPDDEYPWNR